MDEKRGAVSMHRTIDFPNLGIHLKSVGDHITVFGFDIAYYGIVIGIGNTCGTYDGGNGSKAYASERRRLL